GGGGNNLTLNGGTLGITGSFANIRAIALGASGGGIDVTGGQTLTQNGAISGAGDLNVTGAGMLILNDTNPGSGPVHINGGTLRVDTHARLGDAPVTTIINQSTTGISSLAGTIADHRAPTIAASGGGIE